jgi:hypothetical protein
MEGKVECAPVHRKHAPRLERDVRFDGLLWLSSPSILLPARN